MVETVIIPIIEQNSGTATAKDPEFRIVEIFESLQGEGYNTGMPAIFIRLGRCDLACPWCDTDYLTFTPMPLSQLLHKLQDFTAKNIIITGGEPAIHPHLTILLDSLKSRGYYLCIESNGLHQIPAQIDYIATSPKACYAERYQLNGLNRADEVRIVVDIDAMAGSSEENVPVEVTKDLVPTAPHEALTDAERRFINFAESMAQKISAKHYYLSPLEQDGQMTIYQTIRLIGLLNTARSDEQKDMGQEPMSTASQKGVHWQLSVQTHKWAGIE